MDDIVVDPCGVCACRQSVAHIRLCQVCGGIMASTGQEVVYDKFTHVELRRALADAELPRMFLLRLSLHRKLRDARRWVRELVDGRFRW